MSLRWKFLLSYLAVVALALLTLASATALVAPLEFSGRRGGGMPQIMAWLAGGEGFSPPETSEEGGQGPGTGSGQGPGGRGNSETNAQQIQDAINTRFQGAITRALLLALGVAVVAAGVFSLWSSQQIVKPIQALSAASKRIAAGEYEERLPVSGDDELGDLTRSFNAMAGALADTEAMRQQLIADVSHELKTPLSSIKGYMEGLRDGIIEPTPATFQLIHREADRLQRLVYDLQELSRAEAQQIPLHITPHDASELAASAAEWLRPQFADRAITLTVVPLDPPGMVAVDFDRARQVLLNLLGNALQYTPEGGSVTLTVTREAAQVCFAVRDSGVGRAQADLERIFQRFYRVDKSRARASGGSDADSEIELVD